MVEELSTAFEKIQKGEEPTEDEGKTPGENDSADDGSESCPSEGNLDLKELYSIIYCDGKKASLNIEARRSVEAQYEKEFTTFVRKIQKRCRDASKDSAASAEPRRP